MWQYLVNIWESVKTPLIGMRLTWKRLFVPAVTLPQAKMLGLFAASTENEERVKSPLVVFVTVMVLVLVLALTPAAAGHRPIAVARF